MENNGHVENGRIIMNMKLKYLRRNICMDDIRTGSNSSNSQTTLARLAKTTNEIKRIGQRMER